MKKSIFMISAALMLGLTSCYEPVSGSSDEEEETVASANTKKFTFTLKGDFSDEWKPVTRGYLQSDGKDMTDVWVLDYDAEGNLLQQVHQADNTAEDFGKPVLNLAYGSHHIYFIASRGTDANLDTEAHTITFSKGLDTFYKDYEVSVVSTSNGNRAVTLDRVVTKLKLVFTDVIADNAATINVTPATWYYGLNYQTGEPVAAATNKTISLTIPASYLGQTDQYASVFGFSSAAEWTTDVEVNSKTLDGATIGSATLKNVPFKANRQTEYSGPLFSAGGSMTMSLNTSWEDSATGTW